MITDVGMTFTDTVGKAAGVEGIDVNDKVEVTVGVTIMAFGVGVGVTKD